MFLDSKRFSRTSMTSAGPAPALITQQHAQDVETQVLPTGPMVAHAQHPAQVGGHSQLWAYTNMPSCRDPVRPALLILLHGTHRFTHQVLLTPLT